MTDEDAEVPSMGVDETVQTLDRLIARSLLPSAIVVYRSIASPEAVFGGPFDESLVGAVVEDAGFLSTSAHLELAIRAASNDGDAVLELMVPKEYPALNVGGSPFGAEGEAEILLARGSRYRVTRVRSGPSPSGGTYRLIGAEVLPL